MSTKPPCTSAARAREKGDGGGDLVGATEAGDTHVVQQPSTRLVECEGVRLGVALDARQQAIGLDRDGWR
jgi:hypothetical protein